MLMTTQAQFGSKLQLPLSIKACCHVMPPQQQYKQCSGGCRIAFEPFGASICPSASAELHGQSGPRMMPTRANRCSGEPMLANDSSFILQCRRQAVILQRTRMGQLAQVHLAKLEPGHDWGLELESVQLVWAPCTPSGSSNPPNCGPCPLCHHIRHILAPRWGQFFCHLGNWL